MVKDEGRDKRIKDKGRHEASPYIFMNRYPISLSIVFEQYSPTSARPSMGKNKFALFEYKHVTEAGKSSSAS